MWSGGSAGVQWGGYVIGIEGVGPVRRFGCGYWEGGVASMHCSKIRSLTELGEN